MTKNERNSNQGGCVQPCRWKYKLVEETRPGQYFDITEDERGTYILNPKDIALIKHIPDLINAGVKSFKVEGRTKSLYYVSIVAKAYKKALNTYYKKYSGHSEIVSESQKQEMLNLLQHDDFNDELLVELSKVGNRGFTSGFLMENPDYQHYDYNTSKGTAGATFLGTIIEKIDDNTYKVVAKNQIKAGDKVQWITPTQQINSKISSIINIYNENIEVANTNEIIYLKIDENLENWHWTIIRSND